MRVLALLQICISLAGCGAVALPFRVTADVARVVPVAGDVVAAPLDATGDAIDLCTTFSDRPATLLAHLARGPRQSFARVARRDPSKSGAENGCMISSASSASRRIRLTSSRKIFSCSESSVTAVLGCLFPRSRKRRHFGDDFGWHLNLGLIFLIWQPVDLRPSRRPRRILDDDRFGRRPARRLGQGIGHGILDGAVDRLDK